MKHRRNFQLIFIFALVVFQVQCVKQDKNLEDWTVQKRLDRGESIKEILEQYQLHDVLGSEIEGGIIVHLDTKENTGLSIYPIPIVYDIPFGCGESFLQTESIFGTGAENTEELVNICGTEATAAYACDTLDINGYSDWFLPSSEELRSIIELLEFEKLFTDPTGTKYWSSTTWSLSDATYSSRGNSYGSNQSRDSTACVFAVRSFNF